MTRLLIWPDKDIKQFSSVMQWKIPEHDSLWSSEAMSSCPGGALNKTKSTEWGDLFHSHSDIPIKQAQSQLITGVACRGKQIPRHETVCVQQHPALREKHSSASVCFCPACSSYLPESVDDVEEQGTSIEMRSGRGQQLICLIAHHTHRKCLMGPVGVEVRGQRPLVSRWIIMKGLKCKKAHIHFPVQWHELRSQLLM